MESPSFSAVSEVLLLHPRVIQKLKTTDLDKGRMQQVHCDGSLSPDSFFSLFNPFPIC